MKGEPLHFIDEGTEGHREVKSWPSHTDPGGSKSHMHTISSVFDPLMGGVSAFLSVLLTLVSRLLTVDPWDAFFLFKQPW